MMEVKILKQNFSQRVEIQIPKENRYIPVQIMKDNDIELEKFLKEHFEFPSDNLIEIIGFISEDEELEKIIYDLPDIVSRYLTYDKITFDFMKETDSNEKILEIIIYSNLSENESFQKEDDISDGIIDNYPKTMSEFIILVES